MREENQCHVSQVLQGLKDHRLFASPEKCSFYVDRVLFLGFTISSDGVKMENKKLTTVLDWPYPKNLKELNKFLGYLNFYRKFINKFSTVASPLKGLTQTGVDMEQGLCLAKCLDSFQLLKNSFCTAPFLQHFDFFKPRILHVDSSKYALSAVLSQKDTQGRLRPVSFLSRKWTEQQPS
jgi:hypothetical protein